MRNGYKLLFFNSITKWHFAFFANGTKFFMKAKKENYWFMFRVLLLANVVLIAVIVFAHSGPKQPRCKTAPCSGVKRINADILNSVMVKLM